MCACAHTYARTVAGSGAPLGPTELLHPARKRQPSGRMCDCFARVFGVSWSPVAAHSGPARPAFRRDGPQSRRPANSWAGAPRAGPECAGWAGGRAGAGGAAWAGLGCGPPCLPACLPPARPPGPGRVRRPRAGGPAEAAPFLPGDASAPGPWQRLPRAAEPCGAPGRTRSRARRPAAGGHAGESHVSKTTRQAPLTEYQRNEPPAPVQTSGGSHSPLSLEEAADPDRAAQKEKLHAELKRVLQRKGAGQPSSEEAVVVEAESQAPAGVEAQVRKMEKTIETSELLEIIVETEAEAGVSGMSVAGGGKHGLFVKDVLKGSPAARALSLREGDQLLSARVYFDNMKYEDALQILKSAEPYKVSFCLKRTVPSTDVTHSPGAPMFEVRGPRAKMAKLSLQSLTSLKKKKPKKAVKGLAKDLREAEARGSQEPVGGMLEAVPVDVEFSLPKFSKLRKARSAGEVATAPAAQPSPDLSLLLSSLETKRRKLKLPRLKVKEARAAGAARRLDGTPPKAVPEQKATNAQEGVGAKASRFPIPFSKGKKPKEEALGFQTPQVELDFPIPKGGSLGEALQAAAGREGLAVQVPPLELPKVEMALPKGSPLGLEAAAEGFPAGLRLLAAEVAAPKVDVGLSLPRLEGATPEVVLKGEGLQIKVPKWKVSAEETERKVAPLDTIFRRGKAEGLEEKVMMPSLEVGLPAVDVEIPLPGGKAEAEVLKPKMEIPAVSITLPTVGLPKLGSKPQEEEEKEKEKESRVPQVELSVGKLESPKAKAKCQTPALGREAAAGPTESPVRPLGWMVPSLDISAPKVTDMQLPKALVGLTALAPLAKAEEVAEGPRFKLQMPQVSLSKSSTPAKAGPSPPRAPKKPKGEAGGKVGIPALDLSLPAVTPLEGPKPQLDLCVDRPQVEVALPAARLSFPPAAAPALELNLPQVGIELGLPKMESQRGGPEVKLKMPTLEPLSKGLELEIRVPKCGGEQPEGQPGAEAGEGPEVGALLARVPKVDLAFGHEEAAEAGSVHKGGLAKEGEGKLPSLQASAMKLPQVTLERGKSPETEAKPKLPRFALPKFSISGPKAWKLSGEGFGVQGEGSEAADKGSKLKMPKFGLSFPKSKGEADAEGPRPAQRGERRSPDDKEPAGSRMKVDIEVPKVGVGLPTGKAESSDEEGVSMLPELSIELPDIKQKMLPKFSLPKFGGQGKEGDVELETGEALAGERVTQAKASKFKMALLSMASRDPEGVGLEGERKPKKGAGSPKEKTGSPQVKMPQLKLPAPKAELGPVHVPKVELPKFGLPGAKAEEALLAGSESPSLKVKVPTLEIAVPGATPKAEPIPGRPRAEALGADRGSHKGEQKIPQAPSLGISVPQVELDVCLPTAGAETPVPHGVPGAEAKIKLPQVELPTFGRREATDGGGEQGTAEPSKIQVPRVELALPPAQLPEAELPRTEREGATPGPEGRLRMPSVEFSTPKASAPEQEQEASREGGKMVLIRLPKVRGSSLEGEGERGMDLPQLELKIPQLGGSAERLGATAKGQEGPGPEPCPSSGFGLCQADGEAEALGEVAVLGPGSKFQLRIPSLGLSKAGTGPRADTQPLCPSPREEGVPFRMPQVSLPEVGFSVDQEGKREAKAEAGRLASAEGLEAEGWEARWKMHKIKIPALGVSIPKGGRDVAMPQEPEGKKAAFRVPGLELSTPTLKAHAEYQVEGAQLQRRGSQELEAVCRRGPAGSDGQKSPGGREGEATETEAGNKYKVKIPKFGLSLPRAGEGSLGREGEARAKRPAFAWGRPKGAAESSPGLLEGDEGVDGKGVMGRFRLGLSKLKTGAEINGELEGGSAGVKLPKVGFSKGEGAEATLQNGTQDGKGKLGKIRLPQVELSSPSVPAESDPELSLKLVRASEGSRALATRRFRPPKITFSGFKKRNGEPASEAVVSSVARTEMASLERGDVAPKAEKSPQFKFPNVVWSPRGLEVTSKGRGGPEEARTGSQEGLEVQLPRVGFSEEVGGSPPAGAVEEGSAAR